MKYILTRKDGKPIPETAKFFVLRIDNHGKAETAAAQAAVLHYAQAVLPIDPDASAAAYRALRNLPPETTIQPPAPAQNPDCEEMRDAKSFRDLRALINWPLVTELYVSPLIGCGVPSRWQVELMLNGGETVVFDGDSLGEAVENARLGYAMRRANVADQPRPTNAKSL